MNEEEKRICHHHIIKKKSKTRKLSAVFLVLFWERELVEKFEELLNSLKEIDESLRLSWVQ